MPTSIDGTNITGATIDGTEVQEITIDGNTVFEAVYQAGQSMYYATFSGVIQFNTSSPYTTSGISEGSEQFDNTSTSTYSSAISDDGTDLYMVIDEDPNDDNDGYIEQYSLSEPWQLSSASFSGSNGVSNLNGLRTVIWEPDGNAYWATDQVDIVRFRPQSGSWDVTGNVATGVSTQVEGFEEAAAGLCWNDDGTEFYEAHTDGRVWQMPLSTPFDITTKGSETIFDPNHSGNEDFFCQWNRDGTKFFSSVRDLDNQDFESFVELKEWSASTPFDISSLSLVNTETLPKFSATAGFTWDRPSWYADL